MFELADEHVPGLGGAEQTEDCQVVRFGAATGENNFEGFASGHRGNAFPSGLEGFADRVRMRVLLAGQHVVC